MTSLSSWPAGGNPYRHVGQVAEGDRFIERTDLVRQVLATWREPGRPSNLRVGGHHRTGKTSLVLHALGTSPAPRADLVSVRLNVGSQDSGLDLFRSMTRRVLEALAEQDRPVSIPDGLVAINAAVQGATTWYDLVEPVRAFFIELRRAKRYVLAVLDEFDRAAITFTRLAEFQLLRDLASDSLFPVGLITISRRPIESIEMDTAGGSILGGVVTTACYVGMFTDEEADLMLARAAAVGVGLASVRDQLVDRTGLHPFLLELLCSQTVEFYHATGRLDVVAAYDLVAPSFETQFAQMLRNIDDDSHGRGSAFLQKIAAGAASEGSSLDVSRLELMGVVSRRRSRFTLFSGEFGRYLLTTRVAAATSTTELIAAGESLNVEFKSSARWSYKGQVKDPKLEHVIVKTIAGLMNAEGGTLFIGVADNGKALGLEADYRTLGKPNRDGYELFLTQLLDANLSGAALALARISLSEIDGQDVCRIDVAASAQPVFARPVNGRQHTEFWARIGNSTRQLVGTDMAQYQREHWN
jgi:Putative DNA-binding domain